MRIFVSAGEPSGDLHAANLIRSLRGRFPDAQFVGYGGARMAEAGASLLYPLADLAVMWFLNVLINLVTFIRLIVRADRYFRDERPDAVVLVDYPGLHWWIARRAKARGIPVFYFVPPQLWAWAGWRVRKVRRYVDQVLCSLPFEPAWYHARGVAEAVYVGHPWRIGPWMRASWPSRVTGPGRWWRSCPARAPRNCGATCPTWSGPRIGWRPSVPTSASPSPACTIATRPWPNGSSRSRAPAGASSPL